MSIANSSLEWRSVLEAVQDVNIRTTLKNIEQNGVVAYTDGACIKNPGGPAGWSALLWSASDSIDGKVREGALCVESYGHIPKAPTTTNNRAEIAAVLAVLSLAPPTLPLLIYSDSQYVIKVAQGIFKMNANPDLWVIYKQLLFYRKSAPKFEWVQGHAGHEHNERADELAGLGAFKKDIEAYRQWQASNAAEAHNVFPSAELNALRTKAQKLQAFVESDAASTVSLSTQERSFIKDMVKRLQKNNFTPSEKQVNWLNVLARKYRIS